MRISDWNSDVCASDLRSRSRILTMSSPKQFKFILRLYSGVEIPIGLGAHALLTAFKNASIFARDFTPGLSSTPDDTSTRPVAVTPIASRTLAASSPPDTPQRSGARRSEEHTSELQSLMRISYAVFCLKKKKLNIQNKSSYILLQLNATQIYHYMNSKMQI